LIDDLKKLNPGITCPSLDTSKSYCVIGTVNDDDPPSTTLTTSTTTTQAPTTTTTEPTPSNSPTMPGIADNCDGFYKVSSGDQCDTIAQKHSISMAQFKSWNSEINDGTCLFTFSLCEDHWNQSNRHPIILIDCTNLWLDYYVCVHVPGATTTMQESPQPTDEPSGPTPQMPGIVDNCKSFHLIKDDGNCWSIYTDAGITLEQFRSWNKEVDAGCTNLWLGYYVCIGV
jgi:hypothetical protein